MSQHIDSVRSGHKVEGHAKSQPTPSAHIGAAAQRLGGHGGSSVQPEASHDKNEIHFDEGHSQGIPNLGGWHELCHGHGHGHDHDHGPGGHGHGPHNPFPSDPGMPHLPVPHNPGFPHDPGFPHPMPGHPHHPGTPHPMPHPHHPGVPHPMPDFPHKPPANGPELPHWPEFPHKPEFPRCPPAPFPLPEFPRHEWPREFPGFPHRHFPEVPRDWPPNVLYV